MASVIKADVREVQKDLQNLVRGIKNKKAKKAILRDAAKPVIQTARVIAPKAARIHYRYDTPKLSGKLRAPQGLGRKVATYKPGHLAGSIKVLNVRKFFNRLFVGPLIRRRTSNTTGTFGPGTGRFDAFYAQMVFGSAIRFRDKVTAAALLQQQVSVRRIIEQGYTRLAIKAGRENGFTIG